MITQKPLFLLLVFSFLLRLVSLNQSLWLDEAISANVAKNYSYSEIVTKFSPSDFHPPFYYIFLKFWTSIFGNSVISLRLPSVIFSLITGYFIYLIAGFWSSAFFFLNPLAIYYSQEARMYSMVTCFLVVVFYFFLKTHKSSIINHKSFFLFNLFIFLSLFTFYGSIFFILTLFLYSLFKKTILRHSIFKLFFAFFLTLLFLSPLILTQLKNSQISLSSITNWSLVLGKANLKNLLLIPLKFSFGRISFYPKKLYYLIAGAWTLFLSFQIFKNYFKNKANNKYLFFLLTPLLLAFLVSFKFPMLQYFRFLYLLPIFSILLACGRHSEKALATEESQWNQITISLIFLTLSLVYLLNPKFHREDWKSLANSLPQNSTVYMIPSFSDPIQYYRPDLKIHDIRNLNSSHPVVQSSSNLTILPYGFSIYAFHHQELLKNLDYTNTKTINFRQNSLENWQQP